MLRQAAQQSSGECRGTRLSLWKKAIASSEAASPAESTHRPTNQAAPQYAAPAVSTAYSPALDASEATCQRATSQATVSTRRSHRATLVCLRTAPAEPSACGAVKPARRRPTDAHLVAPTAFLSARLTARGSQFPVPSPPKKQKDNIFCFCPVPSQLGLPAILDVAKIGH
eukprot:scaffold34550_cov253-Isochrysis_galbana.AAC.4